MAASRIIVSENIEVPVVDGKIQCIRCRDWKLPGEMHSNDRTCQECYEDIRARNKNKPKPKNDNEKIIKRNAMGWVERVEKPTRVVGDSELAKMIFMERAADRDILSEPITSDGIRVSETNNQPNDGDSPRQVTEDGVRVADTKERQITSDIDKSITEDGVRVADTKERQIASDINKSITEDGVRVADTKERLSDLELSLSTVQEDLAYALREIASLKRQLGKLSPVIEKEEAKRDAEGLKKLRDELFKLLRERMDKSHTNGIYVHSLYGPNGRPGGKLNISKKQAFRLRDACRGDDRFRVEKANNQRGNWAISLNIHMN